MPAGPGEQLLSTVFADARYYFNDPSSKPPHHRFSKGSYVYLYYNPNNYQTKLEVANHAGTPDQDAFFGHLHAAKVSYNYLQPTLISLVINTDIISEQSTWHLPAYDEKNEQKYMYKIHALDLYLWTEKDALTFMRHLKNVLGSDRLDIKNVPDSTTPRSEHRDSMSPVVQQLERTAIGAAFPPRATSTVSAHSFPGPPTPQSGAQSGPDSPKAAPMAYNPAAPAAPEPVKYREKTPPPPDDGTGTGLKAAPHYDNVPQQPQFAPSPNLYQNSNQTTPQHAYFSGPPQQTMPGPPQGPPASVQRAHSGSIPPPPQSPPAHTSTPSFGPMAASTIGPASPPPQQTSFNRQSSFGPTQYANYNPQTQYANYPGSPGFGQQGQLPPTPSAPPAYSGHTPLSSPGMPPPPPGQPSHQQQQQKQQVPYGGYSNYSYNSTGAANTNDLNQHGAYTGDTHSQVYRPTEHEITAKQLKRAQTTADGQPSQLQNSVGKMEKKVGKFFSKLDKLY